MTKLAQPESRAGATLTVGDRRIIVGIAIVALLVRLSRYLPISSILVGQGYDPYVMYAASASYLWGDMPYRDFVFLHPPGVVVALVPFAMVGTVAGDAFAVGLATIASMVMGAITTALVGWFMRPYGRLAMVAAGGMYAVWNAPAYAEQMLMLEPALNLLLMAALLALRMPTNRRYFAAGALLGLSVMVKLWAAVDVLLIGAIILLTRRGKLRRSFVAGVVMGGCALGLPFFLAAPIRMWRMIVSTQLGRPHEGMTLLGRLEYFGPGPYPQHPVVLALVGVLVVGLSLYCLVVLLAAARHRAWTEHATIASIGLTHLVMIATSASFLRPLRRFPGAGAVLRARLPDGGWAPGLAPGGRQGGGRGPAGRDGGGLGGVLVAAHPDRQPGRDVGLEFGPALRPGSREGPGVGGRGEPQRPHQLRVLDRPVRGAALPGRAVGSRAGNAGVLGAADGAVAGSGCADPVLGGVPLAVLRGGDRAGQVALPAGPGDLTGSHLGGRQAGYGPSGPVGVPMTDESGRRFADVVVIGAGQAGLSAAYHLQRRRFSSALAEGPGRSFIVLDQEDGPGGAWRHRWDSLVVGTVNGIHDLPGMAQPDPEDWERSNVVLPRYFGDFERKFDLPILRPVRVQSVERVDDDAHGMLAVHTDHGDWTTRAIINATGTWRRPHWPYYPGRDSFAGRQLHTVDYVSAEEFRGQHVVVVGGGISAVQHLAEISKVTTSTWVTRREPVWREGEFGPDEGRAAVAMVEERVRAGLTPLSVVSVTGLIWTPTLREAAARGALDRHPMFSSIEPDGVRWADGSFQPADVIYWATGFRADLGHLAPLKLRGRGGGIMMDGTRVAADPRIHLVGYGPSSSTVGANRAGRDAVRELAALLG